MIMMHKGVIRRLQWLGFLALVPAVAGCQVLPDKATSRPADQVIYTGFSRSPRVRYGTYPIDIVGTPFLGKNLGTHGYHFTLAEKDGVAYTCRGGHIDIIHVRIAADWTAYLAAETYRHLMNNDAGFSYKLAVDRSHSYVQFHYPAYWKSLPKQRRSEIARELALALGPYLTFTMTSWHEMITWFGFKCTGLPTEFPSAFSWEDSYSNVVGTVVGVQALQDSKHSYNQAVAIAIDKEMQKLGIQPAGVARQASASVRGDWYTGQVVLFVDIKMRNFDIGLGDGYLTPTLVPGVAACPNAQPLSYPVPRLDALARHGFSLSLEIEPHEWERDKPLRIVYGNQPGTRIKPERDFAPIMDHICQKAAAKWGPQYGAAQEQRRQSLYTAK
jgi:hypothetical protein